MSLEASIPRSHQITLGAPSDYRGHPASGAEDRPTKIKVIGDITAAKLVMTFLARRTVLREAINNSHLIHRALANPQNLPSEFIDSGFYC